jgi:hypothetical protein
MLPSQVNDLEKYARSICILLSSQWTLSTGGNSNYLVMSYVGLKHA